MAQGSMDSDRLSSAGISTHSSGTAGTIGGSVVGVRVGEANHKRDDENEYNLGTLPPMWEKAFTPSGEVYFIDHSKGESHWLDPRLARVRKHSLGECGEDELPYGWERVSDERYGCYYVDHINRRTQYENPVLQARRLREEKMSLETSSGGPEAAGAELRGEKFTVTLTKGPQGLGFTMVAAEGVPETEGYLQIRSIVPHGPAWIDGALRPGDVVVGVGRRGVRGLPHAAVAQMFQAIAPDTDVDLHLVRGYPLSFDSEDPNTRVLSTRAVDAPGPALHQLTQALRTRFNLEPTEAPEPAGSQRRLLSRSFDLDAPPPRAAPPRCPSADHLLTASSEPPQARPPSGTDVVESTPREPGRELSVTLRRGHAGFGFTIADSAHGQKVKKVLDRSRCAGLREGDLLLQIGSTVVANAAHQAVVQALKDCPPHRPAALRVWRRQERPPRSRSATRLPTTPTTTNLGRSKTPTAEQLRSPPLHTPDSLRERLNGINSVEATYAVPELKSERQSLIDRRRSSTPGGGFTLPISPWDEDPYRWHENHQQWRGTGETEGQWKEPTPNDNQQWKESSATDDNQQWREQNNDNQQWREQNNENQQWREQSNDNQQWREQSNETQQWREQSNENQQWREQSNETQQWREPSTDTQQWTPNSNDNQQWREQNANGSQQWQEANQTHGNRWPQPWIDIPNVRNWQDNNGQKWEENGQKWDNNNGWEANGGGWPPTGWSEAGTPTVRVDAPYPYYTPNSRGSSDNGGFPEDGMLHSPATAALGARPHSPPMAGDNTGRLRSQSPSTTSASERMLGASPARRARSPTDAGLAKGSPARPQSSSPSRGRSPAQSYDASYAANYPQVTAGSALDPSADVVVRLPRGGAGFGFRIVGGTEDGSRVAVGYVVPGGPADGLLRPGDLLTSVDSMPLAGATHARAVGYVCQAAARGHVTLGVRHNRADIQPLGLPPARPLPAQHAQAPSVGSAGSAGAYSILHPAPLYPPQHHHLLYGVQYEGQSPAGGWAAAAPYDVTVSRGAGEGFGFVVISSTNKATSTIGQLIPNSPAARCGLLHVGDTIVAINHTPIRNLPHPEVVGLIKRSGSAVTLTVLPPDAARD